MQFSVNLLHFRHLHSNIKKKGEYNLTINGEIGIWEWMTHRYCHQKCDKRRCLVFPQLDIPCFVNTRNRKSGCGG